MNEAAGTWNTTNRGRELAEPSACRSGVRYHESRTSAPGGQWGTKSEEYLKLLH